MSEQQQQQQEEEQEQQKEKKQEQQEEQAPESFSMEDIEAAATAQGWSSDGAKGGGVNKTAWEFLQDGRNINVRKENERLTRQMDDVYKLIAERFDHQDQQDTNTHNLTIEEQIDVAVEAGEVDKVKELRKQLRAPPAKTPTVDANTEFVNGWMAENKWFGTDEVMTR
ncbi:hypothetical protein LCGC14_2973220, partial [marine sediment metagenome]